MITWVGLIGKIFSFLAEQLAGKAFDRLGDTKAIAAESLIRVYTAIAELEGLSFEVLRGAKDSTEEGNSVGLISAVLQTEPDVEAQSRNLIDSSVRLAPVLQIFDPSLAEALGCVFAWKSNILYEASRSMVLEREPGEHRLVRLRFKDPSDRIFDLDLQSHYRWIQTDSDYITWRKRDPLEKILAGSLEVEGSTQPLFITDWNNLEWPQKLLVQRKVEEVFKDSEIDFNVSDIDIIKELANKLERHIKLLSAAREMLRTLIKDKLTLDDVLYFSSKIGR
jgi:hypothetical protein